MALRQQAIQHYVDSTNLRRIGRTLGVDYHTVIKFQCLKEPTIPAKRYKVDLSQTEHAALDGMIRKGQVSARKMKRAQILLKASDGWHDADIAAYEATSESLNNHPGN